MNTGIYYVRIHKFEQVGLGKLVYSEMEYSPHPWFIPTVNCVYLFI